MCKISNNLKLYVCKAKNVAQLKNYWILYKFHKSGIEILGDLMMPQEFKIGKEINQYNVKQLEAMLNKNRIN